LTENTENAAAALKRQTICFYSQTDRIFLMIYAKKYGFFCPVRR
jgi:hypothetical protein